MVIFELTNTNFLLTLVILFTFQYGDIRIFLILVFSPIKGGFTFQSGDIQISFLYLLLKLISEFTFQSGDIQIIYTLYNDTIFEKIYIPIW